MVQLHSTRLGVRPVKMDMAKNKVSSSFDSKIFGKSKLFLFCVVIISSISCTYAVRSGEKKGQVVTSQDDGIVHHLQMMSQLISQQRRLSNAKGADRVVLALGDEEEGDGLKRVKRQVAKPLQDEGSFYASEIFWTYGNGEKLSLEDFDVLLAHIGMKKMTRFANDSTHDHDHGDHDHSHGGHEGHDHGDHEGHNHGDHEGHGHGDHEGHGHGDHEGHDHDHDDHDGHEHKRKRRDDTNVKGKRQEWSDHNETLECLTSAELLSDHGLGDVEELTAVQFLFLCPSIIYYLDSGVCGDDHDHAFHGKDGDGESEGVTGLVWLYTMLSVLIISLCALFGILCIPRRGGNENLIMQFLIALAMGSMSGDGMLHLIPHSMVPHVPHEEEGHGPGGEEVDHTDGLYKGLTALFGVYSFFFMERAFAIMRTRKDAKGNRRSAAGVPMIGINGEGGGDHDDSHGHSHQGMFSCTSLAMVIIVGDMFHNFCDGLAIGAAFAGSLSVGVSTSIAVFCHELPHEIGDFAVLITSGMSSKKAICFNLLSTVPCFAGAAIGLELGTLGDLSLWIFAFVGGLFMYIALVDLVPEMTRPYANPDNPWKWYLALHLLGISLGVLIMVILGIYEEDLQQLLT